MTEETYIYVERVLFQKTSEYSCPMRHILLFLCKETYKYVNKDKWKKISKVQGGEDA